MNSMSDPEYIADLPKILLSLHCKTDVTAHFEIFGDSMLPVDPAPSPQLKYVEALKDIKDDKTYIIITHKDGVVYHGLKNR